MTTKTPSVSGGAGIGPALTAAEERYREVTSRLASPEILADPAELRRLSSVHSELEPLMDAGERHRKLTVQLEEALEMESDPDPEVAAMAAEEAAETRIELDLVTDEIRRRLLPKDPNDDRNVLLEVRAGTGGEEAALFAREVFRMYEQYARSSGFRVDVVSSQESPVGGIKEIVSVIEGKGAFSRLKFESGVHRVQRVPATEASGRIHTSAVTVAVLPEADDVEVQIEAKDLRVDTFCSSGPGGQSVNTTYSAVRITHLPSGLVVSCQDEKSQIKNKAKALRVLKSRLLELAKQEQQEQVAETRRGQVGRGDRSEKIRTYNFKENRITDHRISLTLHSLPSVLSGELDPLIEPLHAREQSDRLKALNL
jgi:peptide chain release factor 1